MVITHNITIDLSRMNVVPVLQMVQSDQYSRDIAFSLTFENSPWTIPSGTTAIVRYRKRDGTGGSYDTMPDGAKAYTIGTGKVTVKLAPQVLTVPGIAELSVALVNGKEYLHTFPLKIDVQRNPGLAATSENYFKVIGAVASSGWEPNRYLGTDENGNVVAVPASGGGGTGGGTGMTEEERAQLTQNTQDIAALRDEVDASPVTVSEDGYTDIAGQRQATNIQFVRTENNIAIDITMQGAIAYNGNLELDENGFPARYTENGLEVSMGFTGFDDLLTTLWEGGSY